jgi:hypothetical protein
MMLQMVQHYIVRFMRRAEAIRQFSGCLQGGFDVHYCPHECICLAAELLVANRPNVTVRAMGLHEGGLKIA